MKKIISGSLLATGFLLGASALSVFATGTWSPAPTTPPGQNTDAPLNVGDSAQTKLGMLILGTSGTFANGLVVGTGNVGIGTVSPSTKLEVVGGPIKATGGLILETRTTDPASPATGAIWLLQ